MAACDSYYDLKILKQIPLKIDWLIQHVRDKNIAALANLRTSKSLTKGFYNITPELVDVFEKHASDHVQHVLNRVNDYGLLYQLESDNHKLVNIVFFDYENFPLVQEKWTVLNKVQKIALKFSSPNTNHFDATCLYLMYFLHCWSIPTQIGSPWITYLAGTDIINMPLS